MPVLTADANSFLDTAVASDKTTRFVTSPFARIQVSTTATSVDVSSFGDMPNAALRRIGVYVDGVYDQSVAAASGAGTATITLSAGTKTVDFVNGPTSNNAGTNSDADLETCLGCWITSLDFNAAFTQLFPALTPKVLIYGDSIAVGDGSTGTPAGPVHQKAWPMQLRLAYTGQIAVEAWGIRSIHDDAGDATKRARFVDLVELHAPDRLVMTCGTNDYGLNKWSAASFGTAYGTLLDDLNTALPDLKIFCVTPLARVNETNSNGSGSILQDYRDQITTLSQARKGYVTLVESKFMLATSDFDDGFHPNGGGATKLAGLMTHFAEGRMPGVSSFNTRF